MEFTVDFDEYFVEVPPPIRKETGRPNPLLLDLGGEHRTKAVPPMADRLMADVDAALCEQIFDIPKRQRVLYVHQHCQADDLRRAVEIFERIAHLATLNPADSDREHVALTEPYRCLF
jgi:hypothetical protein